MTQLVHFPDDFYDEGKVKYAAGQFVPLTSETQSLVNTGYADLVDATDPSVHVEALQGLAKIARDRAEEAITLAKQLIAEAEEAEALAVQAATVAAQQQEAPSAPQLELTPAPESTESAQGATDSTESAPASNESAPA